MAPPSFRKSKRKRKVRASRAKAVVNDDESSCQQQRLRRGSAPWRRGLRKTTSESLLSSSLSSSSLSSSSLSSSSLSSVSSSSSLSLSSLSSLSWSWSSPFQRNHEVNTTTTNTTCKHNAARSVTALVRPIPRCDPATLLRPPTDCLDEKTSSYYCHSEHGFVQRIRDARNGCGTDSIVESSFANQGTAPRGGGLPRKLGKQRQACTMGRTGVSQEVTSNAVAVRTTNGDEALAESRQHRPRQQKQPPLLSDGKVAPTTQPWGGSLSAFVKRAGFFVILAVALGLGFVGAIMASTTTSVVEAKPNSLYIMGGGFGAFWFTLGQIQSLGSNLSDHNIYCYSAGCLGAVAALAQLPAQEVLDLAMYHQSRWLDSHTDRFGVLTGFVNDLVSHATTNRQPQQQQHQDDNDDVDTDDSAPPPPDWLTALHIITTVQNEHSWWGLQPSIRTPSNASDLSVMLTQSAWIPGATGNTLWKQGHMDGAFSITHHPVCETTVGCFEDIEVIANALNVALDGSIAYDFWERGRKRGIRF